MNKALLVALVAILAIAGPSLTPMPASALGAAGSAIAAPTRINYYESPCAYRARTSRGIPPLTVDLSKGLIAWERSHVGTAAAREYHAALDACPSVARWNWDAMVLAHTELIG